MALGYYIVGRLGLLLVIPPGFATAVWPASGIALAGTLLFGYRVWPGILLGSFLINIWTSLETTSTASMLNGAALATSIGIGASLQAIVGAFLIRRFVRYPSEFVEPRDIIKFLLMGGPVSCLVNATWGVTSLFLGGIIQPVDYLFQWWTWWIGDTIGVITFSPLVLIWAAKSAAVSRRRQIFVSVPLCLAFMMVVIFFIYTNSWEQDRVKLEFKRRADDIAGQLQESFENYIDVLHSVENLYASSIPINRQQFKTFVLRWFSQHPGIRAIAWNPRVQDAERMAYEQGARLDGLRNFQITEQDSQRQLVRAAQRAEYIPVYYLESVSGIRRSLGFDAASDPTRREALNRARDTGKPTATEPLTLIPNVELEPGFVVYLPIYKSGHPQNSLKERRLNLEGYVSGVFRIAEMVKTSLRGANTKDLEIRLYDDNDKRGGEKNRLLYDHRLQLAEFKGRPAEAAQVKNAAILKQAIPFEIADRRWLIELTPTKQYLIAQQGWQAWIVLAGGLFFISLFGAFLLIVTGHTARLQGINTQLAQEIIDRKQAEETLRETEAREGAILASALDCIITIDHEGKIIEFNPAAERTFGYGCAQAIGKPMNELINLLSLGERHREGLKRYLATGKGPVVDPRIEATAIRADGNEFPVELSITRIPLDGPPVFTGFVRDITQRKRIRDEVIKLAAIVESSDDSIIGTTIDGIITSWNKGAQNIYGYSAEEAKGRHISILYPGDGPEEFQRLRENLKRGEAVAQYETVRVRKDGTRVDVSLTLSPIEDATGKITGTASITRDISEHKRAERELQRQREDVAHRLHDSVIQSLTAIGMHLELAEMKLSQNPDAAWQHLRKIERVLNEEQQSLRSFVKELKGVGLAGPVEEFKGTERLEEVVKRLASQWGVRVELELKQDPSCIPPPIAAVLVYIVQEGVANAVRHGRASVVKIAVAPEREKLIMQIADNGRGFPFRGCYDTAALDAKGVGPATLRSRITSLGGSLSIRSAKTGACLDITVPLSRPGASHADHAGYLG